MFLGKLTGGPGKTSIRAGAGRFFTAVEGLTIAYPTGNPPYGLTYTSPESPLMATPFVGALTEPTTFSSSGKRPALQRVAGESLYHLDWCGIRPSAAPGACIATTRPVHNVGEFDHRTPTRLEHAFERRLHGLAQPTSAGRSQRKPRESSSMPQPQPAAKRGAGKSHLRSLRENLVYTRADGTIVNGTRSPFPNTIGTDAVYENMGNANYNSLQTSLKRTAGRLTLLASYTYGKSMDWASSIQEQVNPFDFRKEYAILHST